MTRKPETDERGNPAGPEKEPGADEESRIRPGESIGGDDTRVGRKIREEQPIGTEPGYANRDNLPDP